MMIGNGRNVAMGMEKCSVQFITEHSDEVLKHILVVLLKYKEKFLILTY